MAWATAADVLSITGSSVSSGDLARAESVVDLYAGVPAEATSRISTADEHWLQQAVAWQAVWMEAQISPEHRSGAAAINQEGTSVSYGADWQQVLAPLAARAVKNLSWKRTRTTGRRARVYNNFLLESSDQFGFFRGRV